MSHVVPEAGGEMYAPGFTRRTLSMIILVSASWLILLSWEKIAMSVNFS